MAQSTKTAIAFVGMPGSGKSVCSGYMAAQGFFMYRFGQIVVDEVARRGLSLNPMNERIVREDIRQQEGINAIAQRSLQPLQAALDDHDVIIIDGLYGFGEYKLLLQSLEARLVLIAVFTPRHLRYARLTTREERPLTEDEARTRDYREIENLEKGGPIAIADYTIVNDGTAETLIERLNSLLAEIGVPL
ncbi:MAG: AAA family ATPase [Chloroflexota bacterium]